MSGFVCHKSQHKSRGLYARKVSVSPFFVYDAEGQGILRHMTPDVMRIFGPEFLLMWGVGFVEIAFSIFNITLLLNEVSGKKDAKVETELPKKSPEFAPKSALKCMVLSWQIKKSSPPQNVRLTRFSISDLLDTCHGGRPAPALTYEFFDWVLERGGALRSERSKTKVVKYLQYSHFHPLNIGEVFLLAVGDFCLQLSFLAYSPCLRGLDTLSQCKQKRSNSKQKSSNCK